MNSPGVDARVLLVVGFVLGCLVAGLVATALTGRAPQDSAAPQPAASPGISIGQPAPDSCLQAARTAQAAFRAVDDALAESRPTAARVRDLLADLRQAQERVDRLAGQCQQASSAAPERR